MRPSASALVLALTAASGLTAPHPAAAEIAAGVPDEAVRTARRLTTHNNVITSQGAVVGRVVSTRMGQGGLTNLRIELLFGARPGQTVMVPLAQATVINGNFIVPLTLDQMSAD
ncbi:hypothetical protein DXV76_12585 [Rhodobacteraceae bacterium CCMM004]|nr:hypothetical protein DXV76_12585 [Rhodobacteraceae bacterium CCMM004]